MKTNCVMKYLSTSSSSRFWYTTTNTKVHLLYASTRVFILQYVEEAGKKFMFFFSRHIFYYYRILKYTLVYILYYSITTYIVSWRPRYYTLVDITSYKVLVYIHT